MVCISNIHSLNLPKDRLEYYKDSLNKIGFRMDTTTHNTRSKIAVAQSKIAIIQWLRNIAGEEWVNWRINEDSDYDTYKILTDFLLNCKNPFKIFKLIPHNWLQNLKIQTFLDLINIDDVENWNKGNNDRGFCFIVLLRNEIPNSILRTKFRNKYNHAIDFISKFNHM